MRLERTVLGYPLIAELTALDEGWDVSITGGCKTHVGAVTLTEPYRPCSESSTGTAASVSSGRQHWQSTCIPRSASAAASTTTLSLKNSLPLSLMGVMRSFLN